MYIVFGFYSPDKGPGAQGSQESADPFHQRPPAELSYPTLDEAMQKLRDWVEADEIDSDGPMFVEYGIRLEPLPRRHGEEDDRAAGAVEPRFQRPRFAPPPPPPAPLKFRPN